jgi:hypothetical protein
MAARASHLGHVGGVVLDDVQALERAEGLEELDNLLLVEIWRQASDEDFVGPIGHMGRDDAGDVNGRNNLRGTRARMRRNASVAGKSER